MITRERTNQGQTLENAQQIKDLLPKPKEWKKNLRHIVPLWLVHVYHGKHMYGHTPALCADTNSIYGRKEEKEWINRWMQLSESAWRHSHYKPWGEALQRHSHYKPWEEALQQWEDPGLTSTCFTHPTASTQTVSAFMWKTKTLSKIMQRKPLLCRLT